MLQNGTEEDGYIEAAIGVDDGSVIIAGYTYGSYGAVNVGSSDFLVAKIGSNGNPVWQWQIRAEFWQFLVLTEASIHAIGFAYARDGAELRMATLPSFPKWLVVTRRSLDAGQIE